MVNADWLRGWSRETRHEKVFPDLGIVHHVKGLRVTGEDEERCGCGVGDDRVLVLVVDDWTEFDDKI